MYILGLCGKKRVGKDTVADYIVSQYSYAKLAFADPLYEMIFSGFEIGGIDGMKMLANKEEPMDAFMGRSLRHMLQTLGTEWGRNMINEDVWVNVMDRKIRYIENGVEFGMNDSRGVVISDVRMPNEAEFIKARGGYLLGIERDTGNNDTHASENQEIEADYTIVNDGDYESLYAKVDKLLGEG